MNKPAFNKCTTWQHITDSTWVHVLSRSRIIASVDTFS